MSARTWPREAATAAHAITAYVTCAALGCGRWGRLCAGCRRRRWSPLIFRARW